MRLALIPPLSLLEYTDETDMQLMLPHLVLNGAYDYTYRAHCNDPNQFVILDNGAAEGEETDPLSLIRIAADYGVDELVIPDAIKDMDETCERAQDFFQFTRHTSQTLPRLMFVIQGKTIEEFVESAAWAQGTKKIDTIGIPRHAIETCDDLEARIKLAEFLWSHSRTPKPVHLLGGSHLHPTELEQYKWPANVRSSDTSAPFNYAAAGLQLRVGNEVRRPEHYFYMPAHRFHSRIVDKNVELLVNWTNAHPVVRRRVI